MATDTSALVEGASRGDRPAVEALLGRFLPDLQAYVRRHAGGPVAARESSADLVQSICRELLERLEDRRFEYRGEAEFRKWLYSAALMKISNRARYWRAEQRDAGRDRAPAADSSGSGSGERFETRTTPSRHAELAEELDRLRGALERLPDRYREVISLSQVDGLSHAEIAARLGISESNSRVLLSRALARLATLGVR